MTSSLAQPTGEVGVQSPHSPSAPPRTPWPGPGRWLIGLSVLAGVVLRAVVLFTSLGRPDSDEVIAGLMARHVGLHEFPLSFWGQHYGGTIELVPVTASLHLFGTSVPALRVPTIALAVVNAVLVWRCARRMMPAAGAGVAGLLAWVWPPAAVWFGVREQLFYVPTVTLGLIGVLLALRLAPAAARGSTWEPRRRTWPEWAGLGLAFGLGWWTSPNIIYFVAPTVVALVARGRRPLPWSGLALAAATAAVGTLPWLTENVGHGLPALHDSDGFPRTGTYPGRVWWFFTHGLPAEMGFRSVGDLAWIGGAVGVICFLAALGVLGWGLTIALRHRPSGFGVGPDEAGLVVYPFLMALIPFVMAQANLRYLFFLAPFLRRVLARVATSRRLAWAMVSVAVVISGVGLARLHTVSEAPGTEFRVGAVGDLGGAIDALDRAGVHAVYADYWVAYRLMFESDERIVARPSAGTHRNDEYRAFVEASPEVAWVVSQGDQRDALQQALDGLGVDYRVVDAGEFAVVFTERPVSPDELPNEARAPAGAEMAPPPGRSY